MTEVIFIYILKIYTKTYEMPAEILEEITTYLNDNIFNSNCDRDYKNKTPENTEREFFTHLFPPLRSTFAVRETASLGIMGAPRVPPLNPSESIVLSKHYRL